MSEPVVAPYGGLMTKTLEDEKERENKLQEQAVEINVDGNTETIRPEAIRFRGVDSLSTDDIKLFIDYYLNYTIRETTEQTEGEDISETKTEYEALPISEQITFRIQWINDSTVNVVFKTFEEANKGFRAVSGTEIQFPTETPVSDTAYANELAQEREAKPYNPIIAFKRQQNLSNRLGISESNETAATEDQGLMEEDDTSIILYVRQSFQSDRKVKNASAYSRYYLMHGEPERKPFKKNKYRQREPRERRAREEQEEEDLFANKLKGSQNRNTRARRNNTNDDDDDDLFADKLRERQRERSPQRDRSPSRMEED